MTARDHILSSIRQRLQSHSPNTALRVQKVMDRLTHPPQHLIPARAQGSQDARIALFIEKAEYAAATCVRVAETAAIPNAIADFLVQQQLPTTLVMASEALLCALSWEQQPELAIIQRAACDSDKVSVTLAFAGIAETGTLLLYSGAQSPTTLNFLPETHIVVLPTARIVGAYEEGWALLRKECGHMPRTVNYITGPSRSGDIEQTMQLGAHGPLRLHIILVGA